MLGRRISVLKTERDDLVDRWRNTRGSERAKLLVKIIDLDDYIEKVVNETKVEARKKFH